MSSFLSRALAVVAFTAFALGVTAAAASAESSGAYNPVPFKPWKDGKPVSGIETYECIPPYRVEDGTKKPAPGAPVQAWFFHDQTAPFGWENLSWDGTPPTCPWGYLRISRWQRLTINGQSSYLMRGGGGSTNGVRGIRFGHVMADALYKQTSLISSYLPASAGKAPASCAGQLFYNRPELGNSPALFYYYYKPSQPESSGAKWDNYASQGSSTPYNYMLWTTPNPNDNTGAGEPQAVIPTGEPIRACEVDPVYAPMYDAGDADPSGWAKLMYGRVRNNEGTVVYGWFLVAWYRNGEGWTHLVQPSDGCYVKEGTLGASYAEEWIAGCAQVALSGNRIGVRATSGNCYVKEGSLGAGWSLEWATSCGQLALSGNRIGVRATDGTCYVKEGPLGAGWVKEWSTSCGQLALSGNRIGVRATDGACYVKEGSLGAGWAKEWYPGCSQVALAGLRIGIRTTDGACYVKEGALGAGWAKEWYPGCADVQLDGSRIGVRTTDGACYVKEGSLGAGWDNQWYPGCRQLALSGNRIGVGSS